MPKSRTFISREKQLLQCSYFSTISHIPLASQKKLILGVMMYYLIWCQKNRVQVMALLLNQLCDGQRVPWPPHVQLSLLSLRQQWLGPASQGCSFTCSLTFIYLLTCYVAGPVLSTRMQSEAWFLLPLSLQSREGDSQIITLRNV